MDEGIKSEGVRIQDIQKHVIRYALSRNPFYYFDNLSRYFPNITSIRDFIEDEKYLGGMEIIFYGTKNRLQEISHFDYLQALNGLLQNIEADIKHNAPDYEGSSFQAQPIHKVFRDKEIRVTKGSIKADGQENVVSDEDWYAYNANYGTHEEKRFVEMFSRRFKGLKQKFQDIHLIRNEREVKIFDKLGRAFEPDFILFCSQKKDKQLTYQVFIEPKGAHLIDYDRWKDDFLRKMGGEKNTITIHTDEYLITAVPFYNHETEKDFEIALEKTLTS